MREILEALLLGIVQGLTEFLPVSSSGHIELFKYFFGSGAMTEAGLTFTVTLHAATALSTIFVFRKDLVTLIGQVAGRPVNRAQKYMGFIILSMVPAVVVGLLFEDEIEGFFSGNVLLVAIMLCVTGVLLFLADWPKNSKYRIGAARSLGIGMAQAVAIIPGISRSGATISTSVLLGLKRREAARFSFLMVLPLIFGKMIKDIVNYEEAFRHVDFLALGTGFIAAFITGVLACRWMISLVERSHLRYFAVYCFIISAAVFIHQLAL